jgi:HSP20 family molecular chaperone IbpA
MATLMMPDPFLAAPFRLLDEFFRTSGNGSRVTGFTPVLDVRQTEDDYVVMVDLAGREVGGRLDRGQRAGADDLRFAGAGRDG